MSLAVHFHDNSVLGPCKLLKTCFKMKVFENNTFIISNYKKSQFVKMVTLCACVCVQYIGACRAYSVSFTK